MKRPWSAALAVLGLLVVLSAVVLLPLALHPPLSEAQLRGISDAQARVQVQQAQAQLQNAFRATLLQALAGLLVVIGAIATWRQVHISREGQITDRFTRAVDQIGSDNINIRVGGVYALGRLATNSSVDRLPVQWLLAGFIRGQAPWAVGGLNGTTHPTADVDMHLPWLRVRAADVQAAMTVLSRRMNPDPEWPLYLSRTDLRGLHLARADLSGTLCRHGNLARAWLRGTNMDDCDLTDTDLRDANLVQVSLVNATLVGAHLKGADLRGANLRGADLRGADMRAIHLRETALTGAKADEQTKWPADFDLEEQRASGIVMRLIRSA
jgi:hypothetical protein